MQRACELDLQWETCAPDSPEAVFVQDALQHIGAFQSQEERIPGLESSHFTSAAGVLKAIWQQQLHKGLRFCEWGSGFGVVTCLAAMTGFDACGIEIETKLVNHSIQLARDHGINAKFFHGSYRPDTFFDHDVKLSAFSDLLGFSPFDYDLIYIYPWPAEATMLERLFHQFGNPGSVMISYQGGGHFHLQRHL